MHCEVCVLFRHDLLQNFPAFFASVLGRRYIAVPHLSQVTFARRPTCSFAATDFLPLETIKVHAFWKSSAINPRDAVAYLEPSQADRQRANVLRAGAEEGQQVTTRLEHAQALAPDGRPRHEAVPGLAHEAAALVLVVVAG